MARVFSKDDDKIKPNINQDEVLNFFEQRAKKAKTLGYKQAVIYQDKNPKLAEQRDLIEKETLLPKLNLLGNERLLDIGCGTGRWTEVLYDKAKYYHGIDPSYGLLDIAKSRFKKENLKFTCIKSSEISMKNLKESEKFDRVCCIGVLMYLNDIEVEKTFENIANIIKEDGIFILREPVAIENRLTIKNHFSDDMEQVYNAIYRTQKELLEKAEEFLYPKGFILTETDDLFQNNLNNRVETKQKYFVFKLNSIN